MFVGSATVYKLMYLVGFAAMMVINLLTYKKYNLNKIKVIILTLITYVSGVTGAMIMGKVYTEILFSRGLPGYSKVAIFGAVIFTPIFMTLASLIFRQDWRKILDMLAPGIYIILACAKFGCFLDGCCHGIECSFGIKYLNNDMTVFPIQIIEVFLMSLIITFCFSFAFKSKHYVEGTVYPVTTIIYCFIRFFVEFFRYYADEGQRHLVLGMTFWQMCCILSIIVSVIWIVVLRSNKVKNYYTQKSIKELEKRIASEKKAKYERAENIRKKKAKAQKSRK